jgi:aspartate aminotransferase
LFFAVYELKWRMVVAISAKIKETMENSSWIRRMFEAGNALRKQHGADKVFDFSLGNPDVEPPQRFQKELEDIVTASIPRKHGYMPNAGYPEVRTKVARQVSIEQGTEVPWDMVVMSCGAGGGLNASLKTLLDPGDEVITCSPCFVEYSFYADNHGGTLVIVPGKNDFDLDVDAIRRHITPKTKVVIVNSPNNPSGKVYPRATLEKLAVALTEASRKTGRTIYILSDEPYRKIVYDGVKVPGIMGLYPHSIVVSSYSKDLSLPGERIGFIAVNPAADDARAIVDGTILCTRILGFVNAPALMQRVIAGLQGAVVDVETYRKKRDMLCSALSTMGYRFLKPEGAFYLFPEAPGGDDLAFVSALQEEHILVVPGRGFALPGYFRIAYCVETSTIERSLPGFERVARKFC